MLKPRTVSLAEISPDPIFRAAKVLFQSDQPILHGHTSTPFCVEMVDSCPQYREFNPRMHRAKKRAIAVVFLLIRK